MLAGTAAQETAGRIEGTIVDGATGNPVEGVSVSLDSPGGSGAVTTDAEGRFSFENVRPGTRVLHTSRAGYLPVRPEGRRIPRLESQLNTAGDTGPYATSGRDSPFYGIPVAVGAGETIRILPVPVVSGRVFDLRGEPVREVTVVPFRYTYDAVTGERTILEGRGVTTNDRGEFRFNALEPGEYGFRVVPSTLDLGRIAARYFYSTWYPGATNLSSAEMVDVRSGEETRLRDMTMVSAAAGPRLWLQVSGDGTWSVEGRVSVRVRPAGQSDDMRAGTVPAGERIDVGEWPQGAYEVAAEFRGPSGASRARQIVDLAAADTEARLILPAPVTLTGRVVDASTGEPVPGVRAELTPTRAGLAGQRLLSNGDGSFGRPGLGLPLAADTYRITVTGVPEGMHLAGIETDGRDVRNDPVELRPGQSVELVVSLAGPAGRVAGTVVDDGGREVPGAVVVLVPEDRGQRQSFAATLADAEGAFDVRHAPGVYGLYAWPELDGAAYRNPRFMSRFEDRGVVVRVEPGGELFGQLTILDGP